LYQSAPLNNDLDSIDFIPFAPQYRASGVLLHVSSLTSPYGIGDLGPAALAAVDRFRAAGQSWWQALPLGPTGYGNSPYQCLSSFAGNELLISPDWLIEEGFLRAGDCDEGRLFSKNAVDYNAVIPFKYKLLHKAWSRFNAMRRSELRLDYERFCLEQAHWLDDYDESRKKDLTFLLLAWKMVREYRCVLHYLNALIRASNCVRSDLSCRVMGGI
jgi:4-alpha-glucanotransferase